MIEFQKHYTVFNKNTTMNHYQHQLMKKKEMEIFAQKYEKRRSQKGVEAKRRYEIKQTKKMMMLDPAIIQIMKKK